MDVMAEFKTSITKEELQMLEPETLPINVVVLSHTSSLAQVEEACNRLREHNKVLGFDTETKPSFRKGKSYKVSLLQLSSPDLVVLFRLIPSWDKALLEPLQKVLKSKRIAKVGVAIGDDAKGLWTDHNLVTNRMVDLRTLSTAAGVEVLSLTRLYAVLYNKRISKGQRLSDWERGELTEGQVDYAALDAYAGLKIYEGFSKALTRDMYFNLEVQQPRKKAPKNRETKK